MPAERHAPEEQPAGGSARELSRNRTTRARRADTGRRHHIGEVPAVVTVIKPDGTVTTTRTSALQLKDQTLTQLAALEVAVETEMGRAADALDFELAAHLRDELAAVRQAISSR